jgi:hypothetical protein
MSMSLPRGWKVERPSHDPNYVGTIGPLRRADEGSLRLARRRLREIEEKGIEGDGRYLVEKATGEEFEVVTAFVDLTDPKLTGTTAFTVRDGLLVPLRPVGWQAAVETREVGEIFGRKAGPSDPLPRPVEVY